MAKSERVEKFAKQVGFYAFNRWAKKQGYSMEFTLCVVRNVFC